MHEWTEEEITKLRKSLKLTQHQFSEALGVTDVYVNYLEKGTRKPSKTLCILFDCMEKKAKTRKGVKGHGNDL